MMKSRTCKQVWTIYVCNQPTRSTQLSIPPGSVKWRPSSAGKKNAMTWFIPFADKRLGVQVKLWNPLTTRAIRQRFWGGFPSKRRYIKCPHLWLTKGRAASVVSIFAVAYFLPWSRFAAVVISTQSELYTKARVQAGLCSVAEMLNGQGQSAKSRPIPIDGNARKHEFARSLLVLVAILIVG